MWVHDSIQKKKLLEYKEYIVEKNYTDMLVDSRKRKYKDFNFDSDEIMNSTDKIKSNKQIKLDSTKINKKSKNIFIILAIFNPLKNNQVKENNNNISVIEKSILDFDGENNIFLKNNFSEKSTTKNIFIKSNKKSENKKNIPNNSDNHIIIEVLNFRYKFKILKRKIKFKKILLQLKIHLIILRILKNLLLL